MEVKHVDKKEIDFKEKVKKSFKRFCAKSKKFFIKIWNYIKRFLKNLKDKFMELPKKVRLVIYVWAVVLLLLLIFIEATSSSKKFFNKYSTFESNVSAAALEYVKDKNIFATIDKKVHVELAILREEKYVDATDIDDNTCEGVSVIYYDDSKSEYVVDTYLNCDKYTSKYYWDYK